jgi:hypothetical protein
VTHRDGIEGEHSHAGIAIAGNQLTWALDQSSTERHCVLVAHWKARLSTV